MKTYIQVFDICRRRWVRLTPEEEVRQRWLHYLINHLFISKALVKVEQCLANALRADIVVYKGEALTPYLILECKSPTVVIGEADLQQLLCYQRYISAHALAISNGMEHFFFERNTSGMMQPVPVLSIMQSSIQPN
ncbi:MAG: type I restriction enzyme HsdR N-terminal domain-containing protein [Bernardetiaceae bacterium]|nr:type I restriction enzyme HsdR N-terminal domain-containing protein [Bernardetiaceae bacterium]